MQAWSPQNGWPLAEVARKRGWTMYEVPGATVAYSPRGTIYVEGELGEIALKALAELGVSL